MHKIVFFLDWDDTITKISTIAQNRVEPNFTDDDIKTLLKNNAITAIREALAAGHYVVLVTSNKNTELIKRCLKLNCLTQEELDNIHIKNPPPNEKRMNYADTNYKYDQMMDFLLTHKDADEAYYFDDNVDKCNFVRGKVKNGIQLDEKKKINLASIWATVLDPKEKTMDPEFSDHFTCMLNLIRKQKEALTETGKQWLQNIFLMAVESGDISTATFCLQNGADFKAVSPNGSAPIFIAAKKGEEAMVEFLTLQYSEEIPVEADKTPAQYLEESKKNREQVGKKEIDEFESTWDKLREALDKDEEVNAEELSKKINLKVTDKEGNTLLHNGVTIDVENVVKFLLENRLIDVNARNNDGKTAFELIDEELTSNEVKKLFEPYQAQHAEEKEVEGQDVEEVKSDEQNQGEISEPESSPEQKEKEEVLVEEAEEKKKKKENEQIKNKVSHKDTNEKQPLLVGPQNELQSPQTLIGRLQALQLSEIILLYSEDVEKNLREKLNNTKTALTQALSKPMTDRELRKLQAVVEKTENLITYFNKLTPEFMDYNFNFYKIQVKKYKQTIFHLSIPQQVAVACFALAGALIAGVGGLFAGSAAGTVVPGVGTVVGGIAGAGAGAVVGAAAGTALAIGFFKRSSPYKEEYAFLHAAENYLDAVQNSVEGPSWKDRITSIFLLGKHPPHPDRIYSPVRENDKEEENNDGLLTLS